MQREMFNQVMNDLIAKCQSTLQQKAKEYAPSIDRLHNFKVAAELNGETPVQACWGMATKHIVSIADMVRENGEHQHPISVWDEKVGDALNYLILLYALETEQQSEPCISKGGPENDALTRMHVHFLGRGARG